VSKLASPPVHRCKYGAPTACTFYNAYSAKMRSLSPLDLYTRIVQRKQCLNRTSVHPVCYIPTDPVVEPPRPGKTSHLGQSRASSSTNQLQPSKKENHLIFPLFKSVVSSAWRVVLAAGSGFWNKAPQINSNVDLLFLVELVSLW
jgi:hypothetical protein